MKFLKLEILNLASLDRQDGETINFEEGALGNSTIFSIIGPTGSGKSTLLDAICLALYKRAPRYPKKKGDKKQHIITYGAAQDSEKNRLAPTDACNILTRDKKEGYSKLTFLANNGILYRAEWHVKLLRVNYDSNVYLYKISTKDGIPFEEEAEWDELPQIIGLDYEQFLRTVLIAQGSFANFLTASEDERYQLLEKLVGCEEQYRKITDSVNQQYDEALHAYKQITSDFAAFEKYIIPEGELAVLIETIAKLETEEKKAKEGLAKVTAALAWYTAEEKLTANITKYQVALETAQKRLDEMRTEADRLSLHDSTLEAVNLYKDTKTCEKNIALHETSLKKLDAEVTKSELAITSEQNNFAALQESATKATAELEKQKPHINKAREIKAQLQESIKNAQKKNTAKEDADKAQKLAQEAVKKNTADIKKAEDELGKALKEVDMLTAKIRHDSERLRKNVEEADERLSAENSKTDGKDITKLQEAKTMAEMKQNDLANAIRIQATLKEKTETKQASEEKQKQLAERNMEIGKHLATFDIEALRRELDTEKEYYTLTTSEKWEQHRIHLKDGQHCPLCGSKEHPFHSANKAQPVVDRMKALLNEKQRTLDLQTKEQTSLLQEQSRNEGILKTIGTSLANLAKEMNGLCREWAILHTKYAEWPEDADRLRLLQADIDKEKELAAKELKEHIDIVKNVETLRKKKEKTEKELALYNETSALLKQKAEENKNKANNRLTAEKAKTENLLQQVQEKTVALQTATEGLATVNQEILDKKQALKAEIGNTDPDTLEKQLTNAKDTADKKAKAKSEEILKMQGNLQGIRGKIDTTRQSKHNEETLGKQKKFSLDQWLAIYNKEKLYEQKLTTDDIAQLYSSTDDWEAIRSRQKTCTEAFTSAQTTLQNEVKAHEEHQPAKPEADKEALTQRKTELENISNDELVNAKAQLKSHNDAKLQMGNMFEQMKGAETLKNEWEEIYNAIGKKDGDQLRKIAQCYTLRFLIEHANDEIRKFNTRYELQQVKNSLGIRVIDHDRADDVRDTTSLSGGETFIVSLGLALGLSALSSRNISFDNLFIDEGFGTLDPDTLATVIDSLSMLQSSQGKKVGVISHTDTMSERITTQIRIIKNGSGSSHVEIYP